jgi:hypothetical protein
MKLTKELMEQGKSVKGAWSNKQLSALGLPDSFFRRNKSLKGGWYPFLLNSEVTQKQFDDFIALTDKHLENKRRFTPMKDLLFGKEQTLEENHLQSICSEPQDSSNPEYRRAKYRQRGYSDEEIKRIMS